MGLPREAVPPALLGFNIGIELGQLTFVALVLGAWWLARRAPFSWPRSVQRVPAYSIGALGAFWFLERLALALPT